MNAARFRGIAQRIFLPEARDAAPRSIGGIRTAALSIDNNSASHWFG
jgi:hypothetical protein